jgi:hypothetical protein
MGGAETPNSRIIAYTGKWFQRDSTERGHNFRYRVRGELFGSSRETEQLVAHGPAGWEHASDQDSGSAIDARPLRILQQWNGALPVLQPHYGDDHMNKNDHDLAHPSMVSTPREPRPSTVSVI